MIFKFFSKYADIGIKRCVLKSLIQRSKRFVKIFKNMRVRSIKVEKIREITKSAVFPSFSAPTWLFFIILKNGFFLWIWLGKTDLLMPISTYFETKKKTLLLAIFFITKGYFRWSILILAKNAFCKCFLELKNTLVFTTWNWFLSNLWKIFHP